MSFHEISIAIHQFPPLICNIFSADSTNLLARSNLSLLLTGVRRTWVSYAYVLDCWACWYTTPPSFPMMHKFSLNSPSFWSPPSRPGGWIWKRSLPSPAELSWANQGRRRLCSHSEYCLQGRGVLFSESASGQNSHSSVAECSESQTRKTGRLNSLPFKANWLPLSQRRSFIYIKLLEGQCVSSQNKAKIIAACFFRAISCSFLTSA